MKTCFQVITLLAVSCSLATAQLKVPRKAFPITELDKAKAVALEKGKPLVFVDTWLGISWGSTFVVGSATFDSFKSVGVFVLIDNNSKELKYKGAMPRHLRSSLGQAISPVVVVSDPSGAKPLLSFSAKGNNSDSVKKLARKFRKKLKNNPNLLTEGVAKAEKKAGKKVAKKAEATDDTYNTRELLAESQAWSNISGKKMTAAVISVSETHVLFLMKGDKEVSYALTKLSDESREKIAALK